MSFNRNRNTDNQIDENTPLYSSRITLTYLEFIKRYYPDVDIDSLLTYAGMTRHEVADAGHWFNQNQTLYVHDGEQACRQHDERIHI